ncbi:hypothetical protein PRIC2_012107 [Phytophthora ramorum]
MQRINHLILHGFSDKRSRRLLTGTVDVCKIIADFSKCLASEYLLPNETIAFSMISTKEEFTFTNMALIKLEGESAATTRKLVERYKCKSIALSHVKFESHEQGRKAELPQLLAASHSTIKPQEASHLSAAGKSLPPASSKASGSCLTPAIVLRISQRCVCIALEVEEGGSFNLCTKNSFSFSSNHCSPSHYPPFSKTSQENAVSGASLELLPMASGTDTFPARSGALWPALNDEELTTTASSTTSTVTTTRMLPHTPHAQLNELSAFLASTAATCGAQTAATPTFLDDLLQEDADGQSTQNFHLQEDAAVSSAMTDEGVMSDAAFFSLGGDHGTSSAGTNSTRLLQLETNYERKKKRAKINRKDLNSRFQELMDILHLKEDRKLNRAKILEKTIEHIDKLTTELKALRAGHPSQQQALHARKAVSALHNPQIHGMTSAMAHSIGQHNLASAAQGKSTGGPRLLPFNPSQSHPWTAGTSLPLTPMMWVPCPVVTSSGMMLKRAAPGRPAEPSTRKRGRIESIESSTTTISEPASSASETESSPETSDAVATPTPSGTTTESSLFEWSAQEIPTLLSYCDAWTLVSVMGTSRELRRSASSNQLWVDLCRVRWRIPSTISIPKPRQQWLQWHETSRIPDCASFTRGGILFSSGRAKGINVWGLLSHRSNGRTTRTVLLNGKATVMQVVELFIVVQNLSSHRVRVTDCISLASKTSTAGADGDNSPFQPFTAASGAHLMPQVVAVNADPCVTKDLDRVTLRHGDLCVMSVFMACPGLELEDQFLQRAGQLSIQCELDTRGEVLERVNVRAICKDHNDNDRSHEKAMMPGAM